jgi:hypothetical protein
VRARLSLQAAGLFLMSLGSAFEVLSAMMSSPWTIENVGGDASRARSAMKYTYLGLGMALCIGAGASLLTATIWPLLGVILISIVMICVYRHAIATAQKQGNRRFGSMGGQP